MPEPSPRRRITLPRLVRTAVAAACAVTMAAWGTASAAAEPGLRLPSKDPFYTYSGSRPLSEIAPGTVLKKRAVTVDISSLTVPYTAEQVLYRTTGELGQPTVTVTTIIEPTESPLGDIVSYQSFYDALGSQCDPSYTLRGGNPSDNDAQVEAGIIASYVTAGYTVTVPDFEGTNLEWAAGQESGYGTLDGIRATENYLGVPRSTPVGMLGYSGGSIGTEWASELAPQYAPELNIVGAASGGVPVDYAQNLTYINGDSDWAGVIPAVMVSLLGRAFGVNIDHYLSAYGQQIAAAVANGCIGDFASEYPGLTYQQLLKPAYQDVFQIPVFVRIMNKEIMGSAPAHPAEPVLLAVGNSDGTGDGIMVAGDVDQLAYEYCQQGVPVTFDEYTGLPHTEAAGPFMTDAQTFLENLFAGLPPSNGCSSIGPGTSIAPLPKPGS